MSDIPGRPTLVPSRFRPPERIVDAGLVKYDGKEDPAAGNRFSGANSGHYSNPQVTDLIERFRLTVGASERGLIAKQIADLVTQDVPILPLDSR